MKRLTATELSFLRMPSNAGDRHRSGPEDKVTVEMHRMIRSLDRRGHVSAEEENGITTVTLTALGQEEVENG